jgi:hypothetical protein
MATVKAVWNTSRNLRDSIRIVKMAKSISDVDWLATTFLDMYIIFDSNHGPVNLKTVLYPEL